MGDIRTVRKIIFNDVIACISDELLEYLDIKHSIEYLIDKKDLNKGFDYEVIPRHLIDNKVNLNKLKNNNNVYILKQSGIFKIINNRRQSEAIDIGRKFSIPLKFIKEREYAAIISKSFAEYECTQQFFVPREDKNGYFIDLYIRGKDKNIAIEIDENGHNSYDEEFEIVREQYIKEKLGCDFIRFNPDCKNFNIGTVINKIRSTTSKKIHTLYQYIDKCEETFEFINETLNELEDENLAIIKFIDALEIEDTNCGVGNKLRYEKSCYGDDNYIVYLDELAIMSTEDIVNTKIIIGEDSCININIRFYHESTKREVDIMYKIFKDTVHIQLQGRLKSLIYIKDYFNKLETIKNKVIKNIAVYN